MFNGLWTAVFQANNTGGAGSGVAVLRDGKILGGDAQFTYIGHYAASQDGNIEAEITCKQYNQVPGQQSVFGPLTNFRLVLKGKALPGKVAFSGHIAEQPQAKINIELTKRAEL